MKRLSWLALSAPCLLLLFTPGCTRMREVWDDVPGSPRVVVTIAPLYSFVRAVGGDRVAIKCLCTNKGPHDYEANFQESRCMKKADVVFAVGLELDDGSRGFAETLHRMSGRGDDLPLVKLGEKLKDRDMVRKMRAHKHTPGDAETDKPHVHGEYDPHVWLGIDEAVVMVEAICDELCEIDPNHRDEYQSNAAAYVKRLKALKAEWAGRFEKKKVSRIVSFHDAFQYFADCFGLQIAEVIELAPGTPPSAFHLQRLAELCRDRDNPIGAITTEPQYPDSSSARTLQQKLRLENVSVPLVPIDPLETADHDELMEEGADWYVDRMRQNLQTLDKALK
jgi:ABC-type Zn uptake system ZnuABC Zn-binding protein ZnuA